MARAPGGPRVRYIALRVDAAGALSRRGLIEAIRAAGREVEGPGFENESGLWLTRFGEGFAIVRCHHTHANRVREVLGGVARDQEGRPLDLEPLATSGTIRTLVERHVPGLKEEKDRQGGSRTPTGRPERRPARGRGG